MYLKKKRTLFSFVEGKLLITGTICRGTRMQVMTKNTRYIREWATVAQERGYSGTGEGLDPSHNFLAQSIFQFPLWAVDKTALRSQIKPHPLHDWTV